MIKPTPALVTHRAAQRLPRVWLWLLSAAYLLPGLFGRDPWRNADITAFGYMASMAEGRSPWWAPSLGGLPGDAALLPYWIGAAAIRIGTPWLDAAFAVRLPFMLLLLLTITLTWYASYHLARTDAAQPLPFAFGGEAEPVDYARAIADGAVLALMATLGLLQLGHETTPELAQLAGTALFLYAMAAAHHRPAEAAAAAMIALPALASSGAPSIAVWLGLAGVWICWVSSQPAVRRHGLWVGLATVAAVATATALDAWHWRLSPPATLSDLADLLRLFAWFTWPALPLAGWTLWRWRGHWTRRHMSVPLVIAMVAVVASIAMGGVDRSLMLALPALAVLAAFALPTLQRSTGAAIDWFSVFFFSLSALAIWVIYLSVHTGVPAQPMANVLKLAPGFVPSFSWLALMFAAVGSAGWIALVFWRTGRHRHPLWKSMVLPAGGVALSWLLSMSLLLPMLDYARSDRPLVEQVAARLPKQACLAMPGAPAARLAAFEVFGRFRVDATRGAQDTTCRYLLRQERREAAPATAPTGWTLVTRLRRPTERSELTAIYRRDDPR